MLGYLFFAGTLKCISVIGKVYFVYLVIVFKLHKHKSDLPQKFLTFLESSTPLRIQ